MEDGVENRQKSGQPKLCTVLLPIAICHCFVSVLVGQRLVYQYLIGVLCPVPKSFTCTTTANNMVGEKKESQKHCKGNESRLILTQFGLAVNV